MHGDELGMAVLFWLLNYWWLWIPALLILVALLIRWGWKKLAALAATDQGKEGNHG